ncbi:MULTISPECIES: GNAT family N-acetyltransferase [unclassified Pseudomonas]|jgi:GNAT superfamily N-acetyltransferase|uniref:GNAT family N-acetyltransferase n=1 Tax=unclassified Pseudomonas TaxID=196821 RepID=UPI000C2F9A0B|nr:MULTISPECIES: GNAT family N-acetyltransferase [unclassified Pseudomonas]MCU1740943.1 GNAT family N-acetyltransferase [Pseudomonas sp. 20S_6.2_Bac1]
MTDTPYSFSLGADAEAMAVVRKGLERFNAEQIGAYAYEDFQLYARDSEGQVIGGMFGHSGMGWLYIDYLWLNHALRSRGLGGQLLKRAEDEARSRGCKGVFLYTYSFQAPDFYQKQGYQVMGVLEDCPPGHQRYYLKKSLQG